MPERVILYVPDLLGVKVVVSVLVVSSASDVESEYTSFTAPLNFTCQDAPFIFVVIVTLVPGLTFVELADTDADAACTFEFIANNNISKIKFKNILFFIFMFSNIPFQYINRSNLKS